MFYKRHASYDCATLQCLRTILTIKPILWLCRYIIAMLQFMDSSEYCCYV